MNNNIDKPKKNKLTFFRIFILCIVFIILSFGINTYSNYVYTNTINEFYSTFNKYDFDKALNIIDTTRNSNILKRKQLKSDLNSYFTKIINKVVISLDSGDISTDNAISILSEIKKYNILNSSLDKLLTSLDPNYVYDNSYISNEYDTQPIGDTNTTNDSSNNILNEEVQNINLSNGIKAMNDKDYSTAITYFEKISKNSSNDFTKATDYILECKEKYKKELLISSDELIANKYYTDAIALLSAYDTSILDLNDKDITNKINSIEMFRDEYLAHMQSYPDDNSVLASSAILESITTNNVNTLSIDSKTPYFVYLNLTNQQTYIYEGSLNNWKLIKSFSSSTGISGEETPKGIFSVNGRDKWFYSAKFAQGGKYWVRFMGDYLFHSLPFDETQTNIVDSTLGTPASHGCVRLKVEDSKWIFDNIDDGTKVIIN